VSARTGHSVFFEPWWLDATAPGSWREARALDNGGLSARLPYTLKRRLGLTLLGQPALTPALGPWIGAGADERTLEELIAGLPPFDVFRQRFSPDVSDWLQFQRAGFSATVRYTHRLPDLSDLDRVWAGLSGDHRRKIRRASEQLEVATAPDLPALFDLCSRAYRAKRLPPPCDRTTLARVDDACAHRQARRMFFARDRRGQTLAALYLVWDQTYAYYVLGARDPKLENAGAMRLLQWEAIKFSSTVTGGFDFNGSMIESIARVFRNFGAARVPYFDVTKLSRRARPVWWLRQLSARR